MTPSSLTARLTIAAVIAVVLTVAALGGSALWLVNHQLRSSLDDSLLGRATDVARLSVSAPAVLDAPGALEGPVAGRQLSVEVLDRHGRIVARSLALGAKLLPQDATVRAALRDGRRGFADVTLDGKPMRLLAAPVADAGGLAAGGAVIVAARTDDIVRTTHRLGRLLALCALVAALLGAAAAALLTRRGLRPLQRLSAAAASIERTGDASARLPEPATADEIGELGGTLNRMLGALDAARRRERRLLADASHELRTPLTSLTGNIEFVARHGLNPEVLEDLRHDAARLQRLVADLLLLEREGGAATPGEPVRLDEIVEEASRARPRVEVASNQAVTVLGERAALERALDNLLENAEVHGPLGGAITVALVADDGVARLSVRDEGPGLPPAEVDQAFDRFWRGPGATGRPGSGLGLAIVKATVERHNGRVDVDGSAISLVLPIGEAG
jgi:two-component system sensor histidine kinase MprB